MAIWKDKLKNLVGRFEFILGTCDFYIEIDIRGMGFTNWQMITNRCIRPQS